jgi:hypothetical protein
MAIPIMPDNEPSDHEFYRRFSDKISRATIDDSNSGADWHALSGRLDSWQRRKWRLVPLWWLGSLTSLLVLCSIGGWWLWYQEHKELAALKTEWQNHVARQKSAVLHDTVWEKHVVYQYDTIFRNVIVRYIQPEYTINAGAFAMPEQFPRTGYTQETESDGFARQPGMPGSETAPAITSTPTTPNNATAGLNPTDPIRRSEPFEPLPLPLITPGQRRPDMPQITDLKWLFPPARRAPSPGFRPRDFRLSMWGGMFRPHSDILDRSKGSAWSVDGEIGFTDHLSLAVEATYTRLDFEATEQPGSIGLPHFPPPGDDYVFKYAETHGNTKPVIAIMTGMRYQFAGSKKLYPWLGLGYAAHFQPAYDLEVEFFNQATGMESSSNEHIPANSKAVSYLDARLGIRYELSQQWSLVTFGFYEKKLNNGPGIPAYSGLRGGITYRW